MRKVSALVGLSVVVSVIAAALGGLGEVAAARPLKVRMDWRYQGYQAPFFIAVDKGYYKAAGLEVELLAGQGSATGVKTVASGAEELGFLDAGVAALSISKGAPLRVVAGIIQRNPTVVISWKDNPVNKPKDMEGKSIAWVPGVATNFTLTALWKANGVDESKIKKVSTTREASESLFLERKTQFGSGFVNASWAVYLAKGYGKDMQIMRAADHGVNTLSLAVVAHTRLIGEEPQVVRAFVAATLKGLKEAVENPELGWKTVVKHKPEVDAKLAQYGLENSLALLHTDASKGKPLGWTSDKDWTATLDFLETHMSLSPRLPLDRYYTNEFIPAG
jgi:ABC-type nitrate/sulfonate/bicarbonate transport system substrate-binding protein